MLSLGPLDVNKARFCCRKPILRYKFDQTFTEIFVTYLACPLERKKDDTKSRKVTILEKENLVVSPSLSPSQTQQSTLA